MELDFWHLHEGVKPELCSLKIKPSLSPKTSGQITRKPKGDPLKKNIFFEIVSNIFQNSAK